jgi:hypothetical protein
MVALHGDAGRMDDVSLDAARAEPSRQPKAITASLVRHRDARDRAAGLYCFVLPPMQSSQQHLRIRIQLSQRAPIDAGNPASNQPTRQAHFDDGDQGGIFVEGDGGPAQVIRLRMVGTPSVLSDDDGASSLAVRPIVSVDPPGRASW